MQVSALSSGPVAEGPTCGEHAAAPVGGGGTTGRRRREFGEVLEVWTARGAVEPFDLVAGIGERLGVSHGEGFVEVGQVRVEVVAVARLPGFVMGSSRR